MLFSLHIFIRRGFSFLFPCQNLRLVWEPILQREISLFSLEKIEIS
jgi:hypothetical protein